MAGNGRQGLFEPQRHKVARQMQDSADLAQSLRLLQAMQHNILGHSVQIKARHNFTCQESAFRSGAGIHGCQQQETLPLSSHDQPPTIVLTVWGTPAQSTSNKLIREPRRYQNAQLSCPQ